MISLWEKTWLYDADTIIVGSGLVGLSCASAILEQQPSHRVLVLERGLVPSGASTKNAGFSSFGTYYEILDEIEEKGEKGAVEHIRTLNENLAKLRRRVGAENLDFQQNGGYDIVTEDMLPKLDKVKYVNDLLRPIFNDDVFSVTNERIEEFGFNKDIVKALVYNKFEGQFDSGKTMVRFQHHVQKLGGRIITGADVTGWKRDGDNIIVKVKNPAEEGTFKEFRSQHMVLCTESFSGELVKGLDIRPFRGQVLVTSPIPDLKMKGTFIYHDGYFYMRDYYGRILIGGGALPYYDEECVNELKTTEKITKSIYKVLKEVILPKKDFKIDFEWAGIMCMGSSRSLSEPLLLEIEPNVHTAIRMGDSGVARCSFAAEETAKKILTKHTPKPKL